MRHLTFITFLKQYMLGLSDSRSLSVHKLTKEIKKNYRLTDSLILYCALTDKKESFNKYSRGKYASLIVDLNKDTFLDKKYMNYDFAKIWDSYQNRIRRFAYDNSIKSKARDNIISLMKEKNISNYRVYKDLKLNHGNINDYLTNGNTSKVSLDTVKKIYNFVSNY